VLRQGARASQKGSTRPRVDHAPGTHGFFQPDAVLHGWTVGAGAMVVGELDGGASSNLRFVIGHLDVRLGATGVDVSTIV